MEGEAKGYTDSFNPASHQPRHIMSRLSYGPHVCRWAPALPEVPKQLPEQLRAPLPQITPRHAQSVEGSKGRAFTKPVPLASAQAGFRAPRLPRSRVGLARGVAAFRGNEACPRGPPRPFRPFPGLRPDRAAVPAATRPSRQVAARKLPATLTPELRNRGGSTDQWLQRRRGRARGGAGRGASTASAPLGNTLRSLPSFRIERMTFSRQQVPSGRGFSGRRANIQATHNWPETISENELAALPHVKMQVPGSQDHLNKVGQLSFRRKWRVRGSDPGPPQLSGCGRGHLPSR